MSMRHLFGFDHLPVGPVDPYNHYQTRLQYYVGNGASQSGNIVAGGWIGAGGGTTYQALVAEVINSGATHVVMGWRARQSNAAAVGSNPPCSILVGGTTFNAPFTQAELVASKVNTSAGDYFTLDIDLISGVVRRWIGNLELPVWTAMTVANLKAAQYLFCTQAYQGGYSAYQYRDFYVGDNADGIDVKALGDRVVRTLPVKAASGPNWVPVSGTLLDALNKAWVTGATDTTASNTVDNGALRVQFDVGSVTPDIDAIQVEVASSVGPPTTSIKIAREGDATGLTVGRNATMRWGARGLIYTTKADGSKIASSDLASMNFDISGV